MFEANLITFGDNVDDKPTDITLSVPFIHSVGHSFSHTTCALPLKEMGNKVEEDDNEKSSS